MAGARFRGVVPDGVVAPGELRLAEGARVVGPFALTPPQTHALGLAGGSAEAYALHVDHPDARLAPAAVAATDDRDGLVRAFPAGLPQGLELRVLGWAVAAARRVGGAVVADGRAVLTPDPASGVDLTLHSAHVLGPDDALGVLRTTVPGARVVAVRAGADGLAEYVLSGETPYDGGVRLEARRVAQVPLALDGLDWREHGPHAYRLTWVPTEPDELAVERPSGLHVLARSRAGCCSPGSRRCSRVASRGRSSTTAGSSCATSISTSGSPRRRHPRRGSGSERVRTGRAEGPAGPGPRRNLSTEFIHRPVGSVGTARGVLWTNLWSSGRPK